MRMYIWDAPVAIPMGYCRYIAVAYTVEEAREMVHKAPGYFFDHKFNPLGDEEGESANMPTPEQIVLGEPTRVLELPCAEWHVWSE